MDQRSATSLATAPIRADTPSQPEHRDPRFRHLRSVAIAGSAWLGLSAFLAYVAYFPMYSTFAEYDDAGYWLSALRSYHLHGGLYHSTYSECGPFYYEAWSLLYSVLHVAIDPDSARLITLVVWV